jgi:serine/threonine protein kinase
MKKLTHENVVRLYEVIDDDVGRYIFMVLEYIPGGPIYDPEKFQQKAWPTERPPGK